MSFEEKAKDVAEEAWDKAKDVGEEAVDKAEDLVHHDHEDDAAADEAPAADPPAAS